MSKTSKLFPLIDGDLLVYRCGFAADAQAKREGKTEDDYTDWALSNVRSTMEGILGNFPESENCKLYLTGKTNFRDEVATIQPYKGNRAKASKPKYYDDITTYLTNYWQAEVVEGMEADDALGMAQWAKPDRSTCIVSTDKDMKQIPGWAYNWVKQEFNNISLHEGNLFFYRQMLEGDRTDNIPGIMGVGPRTVDKIFKELNEDLPKIQQRVIEYYDKQYGGLSPSAYHEVASLLFIRREIGKEYKDYGL